MVVVKSGVVDYNSDYGVADFFDQLFCIHLFDNLDLKMVNFEYFLSNCLFYVIKINVNGL